ncbi:MAG: hypothetical protein U0441_30630 [Polyangiaceae bacterium]
MNRRVAALLVALPSMAVAVASCGAPEVHPTGPSPYELHQQCISRSYATKRKTEGCPSLANLGHRAGEPAAPWDHTSRYPDDKERIARDTALRAVLQERLLGLEFEAIFTEAGYLGALALTDTCVGPAAPPVTTNALGVEDLALMEGLIRDNADVMGLPPFTKLEIVCDYADYHYPSDEPPKSPLSECKVLLTPTPLVDPRIVFRREGAPDSPETERCSPRLRLSSMGLPVTADMVPPRKLDIATLAKKYMGREVTIPGRPEQTFCMPVDPLPGQTASPHCEKVPGTPDQKVIVTRENLSMSEQWLVYWDKTTATFRVYRQVSIGLPSREGETFWDPEAPPQGQLLAASIYRPSPLTLSVAAP